MRLDPRIPKVLFPFILPSKKSSCAVSGTRITAMSSSLLSMSAQSSSRLAEFVFPAVDLQSIVCEVFRATWLWREEEQERAKPEEQESHMSQERPEPWVCQVSERLHLGDYVFPNFCGLALAPRLG